MQWDKKMFGESLYNQFIIILNEVIEVNGDTIIIQDYSQEAWVPTEPQNDMWLWLHIYEQNQTKW